MSVIDVLAIYFLVLAHWIPVLKTVWPSRDPAEHCSLSALQHTASTMSVAKEILRRDGVAGFWRGNPLNLLRTAPYKVWFLP